MIDLNDIIRDHNARVYHNKDSLVALVYGRDPAVLVVVKLEAVDVTRTQLVQIDQDIDDVEMPVGEPRKAVLAEGRRQEMEKELKRVQRSLCAHESHKEIEKIIFQVLYMLTLDRRDEANQRREERIREIKRQHREVERRTASADTVRGKPIWASTADGEAPKSDGQGKMVVGQRGRSFVWNVFVPMVTGSAGGMIVVILIAVFTHIFN